MVMLLKQNDDLASCLAMFWTERKPRIWNCGRSGLENVDVPMGVISNAQLLGRCHGYCKIKHG